MENELQKSHLAVIVANDGRELAHSRGGGELRQRLNEAVDARRQVIESVLGQSPRGSASLRVDALQLVLRKADEV